MSTHEHREPIRVCIHVAAGAPVVLVEEAAAGAGPGAPVTTKRCGTCRDLAERLQRSNDMAFPDDLFVMVCPVCLDESQQGVG